ncbi:MAG: AMP-dependent synthetase/ligase [Vulcanimicrobiaceae bacterium]
MLSGIPDQETLPHLIRRALDPARDAVLVERRAGAWVSTSGERLLERIGNLACAIRDAGLVAGDRIALIAHNSVDWLIADFATLCAGCVVVPVYPTQALDLTAYILEHSQAKLLFADTAQTLEHLQSAIPTLPRSIVFEASGVGSLSAFEALGAAVHAVHPELPSEYERTIAPDDLAVLIYTSGTTGTPKGVMLSHDNITFDAQSASNYALVGVAPESHVLSVLPLSHIYEHTVAYMYLLARTRYYITHDPNELLDDLKEVRPVVMSSVPRIFDRVLAGVEGQALAEGGVRAKVVPWALAVGREAMRAKVAGKPVPPKLALQYATAKMLVLKTVRHALGLDRVQFMVSGSAALHVDTGLTYLAMGIPILQGYGLTESSPVITSSRVADNRLGTVGRAIPGVEVRVAGDGEILARGRNIMRGYYRDEVGTAQALEDGWLHTGDIGEIDAAGYLRITDRKKEIFKTATGKFVAPARVESAIRRSIFVSQALVIGDGRPHPAALICPHWANVRAELGIAEKLSPEDLARRDDVLDFLTAEVAKQTADLATYEQIRRTIVLTDEFSVESGELSPAMKVKRRVVEARYADLIDRAYAVDLHTHTHV